MSFSGHAGVDEKGESDTSVGTSAEQGSPRCGDPRPSARLPYLWAVPLLHGSLVSELPIDGEKSGERRKRRRGDGMSQKSRPARLSPCILSRPSGGLTSGNKAPWKDCEGLVARALDLSSLSPSARAPNLVTRGARREQ